MLEQMEKLPSSCTYFSGVPTPAGAGLALMPMIISFQVSECPAWVSLGTGLWTIIVALLMISPLPTFSLKGARINHRLIGPLLAGVGLVTALLITEPWVMLILLGSLYLVSLPISIYRFSFSQRKVGSTLSPYSEQLKAETPIIIDKSVVSLPPRQL
jgi:CDP-diacylglycerol--serine O-phosphatidyltransferase